MTTAQKIANQLGDDGQIFRTSTGVYIEDLCDAQPLVRVFRTGDRKRYQFSDGSSLVILPGCWEFGEVVDAIDAAVEHVLARVACDVHELSKFVYAVHCSSTLAAASRASNAHHCFQCAKIHTCHGCGGNADTEGRVYSGIVGPFCSVACRDEWIKTGRSTHA